MSDLTLANIAAYSQSAAIEAWSRDRDLYPVEKFLVDRFFPPAPARVLDIGCGAGRTTMALVGRGHTVTAIDLARGLLQVAQERVPEATFKAMNATQLDLPDASFDAVFFSFNGIDCIYPFQDRCKVFSEARRVLVPGGIFYFSSHNLMGQIGRNLHRGLSTTILTALRIMGRQLRNWRFLKNFWVFQDSAGRHLLYAASPRTQIRTLREAGLKIDCILGMQRYKEARCWAVTGYCGATTGDVDGAMDAASRPDEGWIREMASLREITWRCPHLHFVVRR